jgi:hypothetical protein
MSTACAVAVEPVSVHLLAYLCVMNAVAVPLLLVALLARDALPAREVLRQAFVPRQPLRRPSTHGNCPPPRRPPSRSSPLTMHAAVCSALGRRLSWSDSAMLGDETTSHISRCVQTSPSTPTTWTSPVFARMLANTRELPATPCIRRA